MLADNARTAMSTRAGIRAGAEGKVFVSFYPLASKYQR